VQRTDRALGVVLAVLGAAVFWSARSFPDVPGQKVGAGFLPMAVGAGLLACALLLLRRSVDASRYAGPGPRVLAEQRWRGAAGVLGAALGYTLLADRLGFLLVAPVMLLVTFRSFGVGWRAALIWGLAGALVVHVAFYKLLRVPLPWGVLRPLY